MSGGEWILSVLSWIGTAALLYLAWDADKPRREAARARKRLEWARRICACQEK